VHDLGEDLLPRKVFLRVHCAGVGSGEGGQ
jgi:hypothetical protein